jgi:Na+/proline symporter
MRVAGIILVLAGLACLIYGGIAYNKTENVAQFGDLKMQVTEKKQFAVPPVVSGIAVLAGAAMWFGARKRSS